MGTATFNPDRAGAAIHSAAIASPPGCGREVVGFRKQGVQRCARCVRYWRHSVGHRTDRLPTKPSGLDVKPLIKPILQCEVVGPLGDFEVAGHVELLKIIDLQIEVTGGVADDFIADFRLNTIRAWAPFSTSMRS